MNLFSPQASASALAAFLASFVEFVEALTIVLAVGSTRGWRPALVGTGLGALVLAVLVAAFGPALQAIPMAQLQIFIGLLLLLFGMRWLRKAVLRSAGLIPLHDEAKIFAEQIKQLSGGRLKVQGLFSDPVATVTAFKAVFLEGLEVVFIVIATGSATHALAPAALGATIALFIVIVLGLLVHRPLSTVPENALKYCVGILLSAFGTFWLGEGFGYEWPRGDFAILGLVLSYWVVARLTNRAILVQV